MFQTAKVKKEESARMNRLFLLCAMFLLFSSGTAYAEKSVEWYSRENEDFNSLGEHFRYEVIDGSAVLTCYWMESSKPQPAVVNVPDSLGGYPLKTIGRCAFDNWDTWDWLEEQDSTYDGDQVECIVIPEGVTTLDSGAFLCAHDVQSIQLPSTLTKISTGSCFYHVYAEIQFPNGNDFFQIENGYLIDHRTESLIYCNPSAEGHPLPRVRRIENEALETYIIPDGILSFPDSVEYIGPYNAFDRTDLKTIIVPESVKEIDDYALFCNSATDIILHEGLKRIGAYAFTETDARQIIVPSTVEWIGYGAFMWDDLEPVIQNADCVWETENQYNSRIWAEATANDEVIYQSEQWPMRKLEIIQGDDGRTFLRVSMQDGSGLIYLSTLLPEYVIFDEDHASNSAILIQYPVGLPENPTPENIEDARRFFLTFEFRDEQWYLTSATDSSTWTADIVNGIYTFDDFDSPGGKWQWETNPGYDDERDTLLTEFFFSTLEDLTAAYNLEMPERDSLNRDHDETVH